MPVLIGPEVCKKVKTLFGRIEAERYSDSKSEIEILRPLICYLTQYEVSSLNMLDEEEYQADMVLEKPLSFADLKSLLRLLNVQ